MSGRHERCVWCGWSGTDSERVEPVEYNGRSHSLCTRCQQRLREARAGSESTRFMLGGLDAIAEKAAANQRRTARAHRRAERRRQRRTR